MKMSSSFSVPEESVRVFELFLDAPTMRVCIPGCQELVRVDDTHYTGRLVNEIAHVRFDAAFSVEIVGLEVPHEVRAVLKGEDRRLASSLKLESVLRVSSEGDASMVSYSMEIAMWGKLGRMGESIFRRTTVEVERQFVEAFTRACQGQDFVAPSLPGVAVPVPGPHVKSGASPKVTVRARYAAAVRLHPPGQRRRVSLWRRVLTWFGDRGRKRSRR